MDSTRVEKIILSLSWLLIAGIVFAAGVEVRPHAPGWIRFMLLAAVLCLGWEWLLRHEKLTLSRLMLGFLLCHMMLQCSQQVKLPGLSVSLASVFFAMLCICFLLQARHGRGLETHIGGFWGWAGALLLPPLAVSVWFGQTAYEFGGGLVPALAGEFVLVLAATAVFFAFLKSRAACAWALALVLVKLLVS